MQPLIKVEYFLSGGAMMLKLIFVLIGARPVISFSSRRSAKPGNILVSPDKTMLAKRSFLRSTSNFRMKL